MLHTFMTSCLQNKLHEHKLAYVSNLLDRSQNYRILNVRAIVWPLKYLSQYNSLLFWTHPLQFGGAFAVTRNRHIDTNGRAFRWTLTSMRLSDCLQMYVQQLRVQYDMTRYGDLPSRSLSLVAQQGLRKGRLSVCLSRRPTAATAPGGFAAERCAGRRYRNL